MSQGGQYPSNAWQQQSRLRAHGHHPGPPSLRESQPAGKQLGIRTCCMCLCRLVGGEGVVEDVFVGGDDGDEDLDSAVASVGDTDEVEDWCS
jgi:hypothetical protein